MVEILVDGHAVVAAGDLLVRLDATGAEARLARARADLAAAHNQMNSAEAGAASSDAEGRAAKVEAWRSGRTRAHAAARGERRGRGHRAQTR